MIAERKKAKFLPADRRIDGRTSERKDNVGNTRLKTSKNTMPERKTLFTISLYRKPNVVDLQLNLQLEIEELMCHIRMKDVT